MRDQQVRRLPPMHIDVAAHADDYAFMRRLKAAGARLPICIMASRQARDKRIDVYATALFSGLSVDANNDLDLSYTPPFGTPWDAVQNGVQAWERSLRAMSAA